MCCFISASDKTGKLRSLVFSVQGEFGAKRATRLVTTPPVTAADASLRLIRLSVTERIIFFLSDPAWLTLTRLSFQYLSRSFTFSVSAWAHTPTLSGVNPRVWSVVSICWPTGLRSATGVSLLFDWHTRVYKIRLWPSSRMSGIVIQLLEISGISLGQASGQTQLFSWIFGNSCPSSCQCRGQEVNKLFLTGCTVCCESVECRGPDLMWQNKIQNEDRRWYS